MPMAAPPLAPNSLTFVERGLEALDDTGLADADKLRVIGLLSSYTLSEARMAHEAAAAAAAEAARPTRPPRGPSKACCGSWSTRRPTRGCTGSRRRHRIRGAAPPTRRPSSSSASSGSSTGSPSWSRPTAAP